MEGEWIRVDFTVEEENMGWAKECLGGFLRDLSMFDRIHDLSSVEEMSGVSMRYLGDDIVLIAGMDEDGAKKMMAREEDNYLSIFHSI